MTIINHTIIPYDDQFLHRIESTKDYTELLLPFDKPLEKKDFDTCIFCEKRRYGNSAVICKDCSVGRKSIVKNLRAYFTFLSIGVKNNSCLKEKKNRYVEKYGEGNDHLTHSQKIAITLNKKGTDAKTTKRNREIEKYGSDSLSTAEKREITNKKRYGVLNVSQSAEIQSKKVAAWKKKYGVSNPARSNKVKDRKKATNIAKYGVEYPAQNKEIQDKIKSTNIEKYGHSYGLSSHKIQKKRRNTLLERYGVEFSSQIPTHAEKVSETRYVNNHGISKKELIDSFRITAFKYGIEEAIQKHPTVTYNIFRNWFSSAEKLKLFPKGTSITEEKVSRAIGIQFERCVRNIVPENNRKEIDLLNREHRISIEFNGYYWHQVVEDKLAKDLEKAELMRSIGYTHFAIDETDMFKLGLIDRMLSPNKKTVYARQTDIRNVSDSYAFLNEYHLQGYSPAKITYGLYLENKLIQVMSFGKSRFDKTIDWEIIRLCTHPDYRVVGGTQRLWKRFLLDYDPESIVSYSDNKYFSGDIYRKLGFEFVRNTPSNYVWMKGSDILKRYQTMKHKLPNLLGDLYSPELTETENMIASGWSRVKDLGNKKWVLHRRISAMLK